MDAGPSFRGAARPAHVYPERVNRRPYPVTIALIVANVLAFAYELHIVGPELMGGGGSMERLIAAGALVPALVRSGEYWRVVSGAFLHGSVLHLAVNMYSLYVLGRFVETIAQSGLTAEVYAVSLVGSGLAVAYFAGPFEVTVGASGAIFGLFGALFAIGFKFGRPGMRLIRANLGVLLLNLVFTFAVPGISRWGHVGGLVVGFVATLILFTPPPPAPMPFVAMPDDRS
jgi:membrane associated rhomboid family serine protease